jgi:hypothetical protein
MRSHGFGITRRLLRLGLIAACLLFGATRASAVELFYEDFEDTTLASPNAGQLLGTIAGGIISFNDTSATNRHRFVMRPGNTGSTAWADPVLTYSFDVKAPVVVGSSGTEELRFRAGIGIADQTLQAAEFIYEVLLFSNGTNSGAYTNNGNETAFIVANNQGNALNFTSPIDSSNVTLNAYQYAAYVRNNATNTFGQLKGISNMVDQNGATDGVGAIDRFGIGSSTNAHTGTFAMDNVLVVSGVSFAGPVPLMPGDTDNDGIGGEFPDDFEPIRANFRKSIVARNQGDLVDNDFIDFADFREWKSVFLGGGGSLAGLDLGFLSIPEPSTIGPVLVVLAGMISCRRRRNAPN